jgi:hypothetical protein
MTNRLGSLAFHPAPARVFKFGSISEAMGATAAGRHRTVNVAESTRCGGQLWHTVDRARAAPAAGSGNPAGGDLVSLEWFPGVTRRQVDAVLEHTTQSLTEG